MTMTDFAYLTSLEGTLLCEEPMKDHTSFRIGGPAEAFFVPKTEEALVSALSFAKANAIPFRILGNGSNLLVADEGVRGLVVCLAGGLTSLSENDGLISAGAGVTLSKVCLLALEKELTGLEFAYGIPGSVGGAIYMNAGAYGGEVKNVLKTVRVLDPETLTIEELDAGTLDIAYRSTPFMKNGLIILGGVFALEKGDAEEIRAKMNDLLTRRKTSQPLTLPSAGSTFKRPKNGYAAAMIDEAGLKGYRVGGAEVSTKHAGFVVNIDNATAKDVLAVIAGVREKVLAVHQTYLETEVEIW